jgi:hypothetical protein
LVENLAGAKKYRPLRGRLLSGLLAKSSGEEDKLVGLRLRRQ